jgi:predicted phosphodiesterase
MNPRDIIRRPGGPTPPPVRRPSRETTKSAFPHLCTPAALATSPMGPKTLPRFRVPFLSTPIVSGLIRIFSDLHYGDRSSRLRRLDQLSPLLDGVGRLILNGDTLDTRPGPHPQITARSRAEVGGFFGACAPEVTLITGNHDPDISDLDTLDLFDGQVFVTHGDIIFDNIVPWGRDAATLEAHITRGLASLPVDHRTQLAPRLAVFRAACAALPQRHQSEPNPLKYAVKFAADTVWPPLRSLDIIRAWRETPNRAASIAAAHRPAARFMLIGHTHRPFVWTAPSGLTVINTGALCRPFGAQAVDLTPGRLTIRQIESRSGSFHPGRVVAEFALAEVPASSNIPA